jgi:hypothetical protein
MSIVANALQTLAAKYHHGEKWSEVISKVLFLSVAIEA